jgi:hypothetical protein
MIRLFAFVLLFAATAACSSKPTLWRVGNAEVCCDETFWYGRTGFIVLECGGGIGRAYVRTTAIDTRQSCEVAK